MYLPNISDYMKVKIDNSKNCPYCGQYVGFDIYKPLHLNIPDDGLKCHKCHKVLIKNNNFTLGVQDE